MAMTDEESEALCDAVAEVLVDTPFEDSLHVVISVMTSMLRYGRGEVDERKYSRECRAIAVALLVLAEGSTDKERSYERLQAGRMLMTGEALISMYDKPKLVN